MINRRLKRILLILPVFLVLVGAVMLFMPSLVLAGDENGNGPICDGDTWNKVKGLIQENNLENILGKE